MIKIILSLSLLFCPPARSTTVHTPQHCTQQIYFQCALWDFPGIFRAGVFCVFSGSLGWIESSRVSPSREDSLLSTRGSVRKPANRDGPDRPDRPDRRTPHRVRARVLARVSHLGTAMLAFFLVSLDIFLSRCSPYPDVGRSPPPKLTLSTSLASGCCVPASR